ncbi:MAG: 2-hydroxyacid dehydrogenase [Dorea sp.]|nr:2-hydroxyacid dehydrogenase [Dorea sp.]
MKLLIRAPFTECERKRLESYFDEIVYDPWTRTGERYYEDEMLDALRKEQPDALITELDRITEKVLAGYDRLLFIGDCRAVPANIDVDACKRANVPVLCTPARNAQAVAEMLTGLLVSYMRNIIPAVQWVREGKWVEGTTPYYTWMGHELCGKKVGFVGFGAVGRHAARILEAYGCQIFFYDPYVDHVQEAYQKCGLEEIFENSDIVSIHLPVMESTKGMIHADLFAKMKETAIFVNTARSAVVDEGALIEVLRAKKIKGAILDVLSVEPPTEDALAVAKLDNVLLTPHICGAAYEVTDHQSQIMADCIDAWMKEKK